MTSTPLAVNGPCGPMLHPRVMILVRPSGAVQLGWDPDTAVVLDPADLDTATVLSFLRLLDGMRTRPQILWLAEESGVPPAQAEALLDAIAAADLLVHPEASAGRLRSIRVHGAGPLSDALCIGVRRLGIRPVRSRGYTPDTPVGGWRCGLVLLTDDVVIDPRLTNDLVLHRIPHLAVRIRDGKGIVGPLVLPGRTSCLRCADLTRTDLDPAWPHLAAQLLGRVGQASTAAVAATAALALGELESILACSATRTLGTLDGTLELDLDSHRIERRGWAPHPACGCHSVCAGGPDE
ncbi:TOMM precursor leader peptide-binding protein [Nocardia sp. NPDC051832]|uniref:TOMM precursor leader peptide-binding protein n=1 Tax=Nocardia sp. NPDC051832 TaxID=3155673 RepID=UPI0034380837